VSDSLLVDEPVPPDIAGTVVAWRVWRVVASDRRYLLGSLIQPTLWPARQVLRAVCLRPPPARSWLRRRQPHIAPEPRCECGIYGAGLDQIAHHLKNGVVPGGAGRVVGQVSLWGTVIECERGFRGSCAYPLRIFVPSDAGGKRGRAEEPGRGLATYGVPIELLGTPCTDAVQTLGQVA
jgi:hypothetical protein